MIIWYLTLYGFILFLKVEFEIGDLHFGRLERDNSSAVNFSDSLECLSLDDLKTQIDSLLQQISEFSSKSNLHKKIYDLRYWDSYKLKRIEKNRDKEEISEPILNFPTHENIRGKEAYE